MLPPRRPGLVAAAALAAVTIAASAGCGGSKDDDPAKTKWSFISATIIEPSCATVNCHSAITKQGGVDLSNRQIGFETLVNVTGSSTASTGATYYVYPYYPQYSQLITLLNAVGSIRMPPDNPLSQADIQLITTWISDGAQNN